MTIRKNEDKIPSRSGYRAHSNEEKEGGDINKNSNSNSNNNQEEVDVRFNNNNNSFEITVESDVDLSRNFTADKQSNNMNEANMLLLSEVDSSDFSDGGMPTRADVKKKPSLQRYYFFKKIEYKCNRFS